MCAAYGQASGVPDPIDLVEDLGICGSLFITRPVLSHYMSNRSEQNRCSMPSHRGL
jgi:NADPH:quinone reductase